MLIRPLGGSGGSEWSYILKGAIKEIFIAHGEVIDSTMFRIVETEQVSIDLPKFGGNGGAQDSR